MPLTALALIATMLIVAIVIDLGSTRATRGKARSTADAAATAGSLDLGSDSASTACATAFDYAFTNLGGSQPSAAAITSACAAMAATCTTSGAARVATLAEGGSTVAVTHPVPDTDRLLRATVVGGGVGQPADASASAVDGNPCQRIGVEITQPRSRFFGGVAASARGTFSIHSVARYAPSSREGLIPPALVALDQRACRAIDTGSGQVLVEKTPLGPGIVFSDSDGTSPACSSGQGILHTSGSGALRAAASSVAAPGELAWYSAPATRGYVNGQSRIENGTTSSGFSYVGRLYARATRTTRTPVDAAYNCTNIPVTPVSPLCTGTDPVKEADSLAQAASAPPGFTTSSTCDTSAAQVTFTGNVFVSCPTFEVKGNPLVVTGGTIIFKGRLKVASGGTLAVNVTSPSNPAQDAGGLPVAAAPGAQSRLIVGSAAPDAVDISTNSSALYLAQTFLYSRGGFSQQSLNGLRWSAPTSGPTKGLLYWSESVHPFAIQGGPILKAAGVLFHGRGTLEGAGGGIIDLTKVQTWVAKVSLQGSTTLKLSPDPANSIKVAGPGSALIR